MRASAVLHKEVISAGATVRIGWDCGCGSGASLFMAIMAMISAPTEKGSARRTTIFNEGAPPVPGSALASGPGSALAGPMSA